MGPIQCLSTSPKLHGYYENHIIFGTCFLSYKIEANRLRGRVYSWSGTRSKFTVASRGRQIAYLDELLYYQNAYERQKPGR